MQTIVASERKQARDAAAAGSDETPRWRRWLVAFGLTAAGLAAVVYAAVVLIDPYSTGRFSPVQRIDLASSNPRLVKGALVRDLRFDAAIFGSSTGYPLDPQNVGGPSGWRVAQLGIPAALPPSQLVVARAYQRFHAGQDTLQIYVLDHLWCRAGDPAAGAWGAFPDWVYESSDAEYLSRILFPDGVATAVRRIGIWSGLVRPAARDDGFILPKLTPMPRSTLNALVRPAAAPGDGSFPGLDMMAAHLAALPANVRVAFVFAPPYVTTLPVAGSPADARLKLCKARAQQLLARRTHTAFLDLMTENAISTDEKSFFDEVHYTPDTAARIASAVVEMLRQTGLAKR